MQTTRFPFGVDFNASTHDLYFKRSSFSQSIDPLSLPGIFAWYNARNLLGDGSVPADNTPVSLWADLSPNGYNFIQGSGANQPVFKTNIQAGNPGVFFNTPKELLGPNSFLQNISTKYTMYIVMKSINPLSGDQDFALIATPDDLSNRFNFLVPLFINTSVYMDFGNVFAGQRVISFEPDIYDVTYAHCFAASPPNLSIFRNGLLEDTIPTAGTFVPGAKIPSMGLQLSYGYYMFEMICCNQPHTSLITQQVFHYLQKEWEY